MAGSRCLFAESVELCREAGEAWWQGVARILAAFVAWAAGDSAYAEHHAIEGLRVSRLVPDLLACAEGIHVVALLRVGHDDRLAAALLGAAERYWTDAGGSILRTPVWAELVGQARSTCLANIGEAEFEAAHRRGWELPLEEAVARALGERARPVALHPARDPFGLTRREHDVAALLAEGLSNREIAARLVISPRTAETHVHNVLAKTGFSGRSQLAVWYSTLAGT